MSVPAAPRIAFRPDIQGLRAIAVTLVVLSHCGVRGFAGGFIGVDVFFVLSGYLITELLVTETERTGSIHLPSFYARRVRRLLPASALVLVLALAGSALLLAPQELEVAGRAARASALYLANVFFAVNAADYFAADVRANPLLHMWSLAVEEQFYLFWPLLILITWRYRRSRRALGILFAVLSVFSFAACILSTRQGSTWAFYSLPSRAWEFALGGLASLLPWNTAPSAPRRWTALGWAGLLLIGLSGVFIAESQGFPGWVSAIPVAGTLAALVAGVSPQPRGASGLLGSAPMQHLGALSYSWYLWHWPLLVLAAALWPAVPLAGRVAVALGALGAAQLTYRGLENPLRFHPYLRRHPGATLGLGMLLMLLSLGAALLAQRFASRLAAEPRLAAVAAAARDIGELPRERCVSLPEHPETRSCVFGAAGAAPTVVLFGDSHAIQWFNPLKRIATRQGWRLVTFVKSGCPATDLGPADTPRVHAICRVWRDDVLSKLAALHPQLVVLASSTTYVSRDGDPANGPVVPPAQWRAATQRTLAPLAASGIHVLQIRDTPLPPFDVPTCLARAARHAWYPAHGCSFATSTALKPALYAAEQQAGAGLAGVSFLDLTPALCDARRCDAMRDGLIVYRDDNHLTGRYALTLVPQLEGPLRRSLADPWLASGSSAGSGSRPSRRPGP